MPKKSKPKLEPVEGFLTPQQFSAVYRAICSLFEELDVEPDLGAMTLLTHASAMLVDNYEITADQALEVMEDMIKHIRVERKLLEIAEAKASAEMKSQNN